MGPPSCGEAGPMSISLTAEMKNLKPPERRRGRPSFLLASATCRAGAQLVASRVSPDYNPEIYNRFPEGYAMRQLLVFGWVFLVGLTAMAEPPVKVASIEGVTEYRLGNGAGCCSFPRRRGRP